MKTIWTLSKEYVKLVVVIGLAALIFPHSIRADGIGMVMKISMFMFLTMIGFGGIAGITAIVNEAAENSMLALASVFSWIMYGVILNACSKTYSGFEISGEVPLFLLTLACILVGIKWSNFRPKRRNIYKIHTITTKL